MSIFDGKHVLVTGASGTVGKELVRQLSERFYPAEIRAIDNNESGLFFLDQNYYQDHRVRCFLGDVRDRDTLVNIMQGIDIVIHTAALKHVILCEKSPWDAVETNILGIHNIIQAATSCGVERVLFTSSDKAVNPTNVMGTSKLMGERLMTAANAKKFGGNGPVFFSTRFGNVLGSRGSVIPIFKQQIAKGGPVTLTDYRMTRFIMTLSEAVSLVLKSVELAMGGEVFVSKMPVVKIKDLAEIMIEILAPTYGYRPSDIEIIEIGAKPGEKLYEELMSLEETRRAMELRDMFVVLPAFRSVYEDIKYDYKGIVRSKVERPYNSSTEQPMTKEDLRNYLITHKLV
ncbi:MAG: SDR family NAD(P)-dependent oxidoreductase [Candidatus Marinimicrobia bacterium]|nr:SDR family NAD(P)-dependent oxidoreductase [Candidatus Neomarinimicrobiota bacterium]